MNFATQCSVAHTNTYDTQGSLTRSDIKALSTSELLALHKTGSQWHEMTALLTHQFEMRACGVRRYGLYDWVMSSNKPGYGRLINITKQSKGPSLIQPYIVGRQNSVVNSDYWAVTNGWATSGGGAYAVGSTGPLAVVNDGGTGSRVVRVIAGHGLSLSAQYFLPKHQIYILGRSGGGAVRIGQWEVVRAALAADSTYIDVLLKDRNSFDTSQVDATPTNGLILPGINNVHDAEKYCHNPQNFNPTKHVPFFYQTHRRARSVDSDYEETFRKLIQDNNLFAKFQDISAAERNRQDELNDQKQFINSFFFGRPISSNQTIDLWGNLEPIYNVNGADFSIDPGVGGTLVGYRANMVGAYEQLKACSQVQDHANSALEIDTFLEEKIYDIVRARTSAGRPADSIDIYTDSTTADEFMVAFIAYAKDKLGDIVRVNISEGSNREYGFVWRSFKLFKPAGVTVNIITHEFFDDILNTFSTLATPLASRGRFLATLDLGKGGGIYPAVLASNRVQHETGKLADLAKLDGSYACVMSVPTRRTTLVSKTVTAIVEDPKSSRWDENFSSIAFTA
ncbi:MAG TPA: hypothetical protein VEH27_11890 [Methylomirabilota bacterium]|nr:hypothetical protein [Methylomirabilota bacterium]